MRLWTRLLTTPVHLAWSLVSALICAVGRRRSVLVFTHARDISGGRDAQMGPLVDALVERREKFTELCMIPFGASFLHCLWLKRRFFVSYTAVLALAWILSLGRRGDTWDQRRRAARWLLRLLRPRLVYLIDESGSGQPILRAAHDLGIPVLAIQHGDFLNPHYAAARRGGSDVEAADLFCLWSSWFQERLLRVSPIYTLANTRITGRLRTVAPKASVVSGAVPRVLVLGEVGACFRHEVEAFLVALDAAGMKASYRPHPAEAMPKSGVAAVTISKETTLAQALQHCDVVLGSSSSALLEALYHGVAVVVFCSPRLDDPAGFAREGLAMRCDVPGDLPELCLRLARKRHASCAASARAIVWGDAETNVIEEIFGAAREVISGRPLATCDNVLRVSPRNLSPRQKP